MSIRRDATLREAIQNLTDCGYSAAPVIDESGQPIGVISRTDILNHSRDRVHSPSPCDNTDWDLFPDPWWSEGPALAAEDVTTVAEVMTPAIFTVSLQTPAREVVRRMLELKVHHLFVVDSNLALVGVISPLDVLQHLGE